ncbi:hypothetical protein [Nostoc sp.]
MNMEKVAIALNAGRRHHPNYWNLLHIERPLFGYNMNADSVNLIFE